MLNEKLTEQINLHFGPCRALSDYITDNPQLGMREDKAVAAYKALLEEAGFVFTSPYKGVANSFLAVKKDRLNDEGPRAVLMCEYDALPEVGHACGHSMSGAASVLAALALHSAFADLPIRIDLMGTPGEEYPGGKEMLRAQGAFDGYEFAAMAHMFSGSSPAFKILACNDRYITFKGKSAHASANPGDGINAMNAARLYMDAMDMWRQHLPKHAQFHGVIVKGGDLPSIVPENVELNFYYRAANLSDLDKVCEISENCCKAAALATGCGYTAVQQYLTYADLYSTPTGDKLITGIFDGMGEAYSYSPDPQGSSDAGNVDYVIPVFHPLVNISPGPVIPAHSVEFQAQMKRESGYKGLRNAATLLANLAYTLAVEDGVLAAVQEEHGRHRGLR